MSIKALARISVLAALLGAAVSAHAYLFSVLSAGQYSFNTQLDSENVLTYYNTPEVDTLNMDLNFNTGYYTGPGGVLAFTFVPDNGGGMFAGGGAGDATWYYDPAHSSGVFSGLQGGGTFSISVDGTTGVVNSTTGLTGNLNAVPEPATLAGLAIGAVELLRRRRRAC